MVDQTSLFQSNQFQLSKKVVFLTLISVLIATVKNCEEPGTFETVLNSLLTANGLPTFKMGNVKTNQKANKRKYIRTTQWKQANPQAPLEDK